MLKKLDCKDCGRHLGEAYGTIIAELKCPNSACKATTQFKIINGDTVSDIRFKFIDPPKAPKKKEVEVS